MNAKISALIVVIVVAILGVLNFIVGDEGLGNARLDLTQQHLFTLSPGTKKILNGLNRDKQVQIRFYVTRDNRLMPQWIQSFAHSVEDLLIQFKDESDNKVKLQTIDVRPNTEEEDRARADEVPGHQVNENEDKVYFGVVVQCLTQKEVISIAPEDEAAMEYKIARAISKVTKTKRSVIGVLSAMPIAGPAMNLPPMLQQNQQHPWIVIEQLRLDYDVREVPMTTEKIDSDINILLVVHPAGITGKAQFAIDQFLLRGGKVAAFVDPNCVASQQYNQRGQFGMSQNNFTPPSSDLPDLFKAWGIEFDTTKVVADMKDSAMQGRRPIPPFLALHDDCINKTEPVTSALGVVQMFESGAFKTAKKEGITSVTLLQSSEDSAMIDTATAEKARNQDLTSFQSEGKRHITALRLSGTFKTAFPDGPPKVESPKDRVGHLPGDEGGGDTQDAGAPGTQLVAQAAPPVTPAPNTNAVPANEPAPPAPAPAAQPAAPAPAAPAPATPVAAPTPAPAPAAPAVAAPAPVAPVPAAPVTTTPVPAPPAPTTPSAAPDLPKLTPAPVAPTAPKPVLTQTPTPANPAPTQPPLPPKPAPRPVTTVTTPPVTAPAPAVADQKPAVPSTPAAKPEAKVEYLKESQNGEGMVYLFADADMLYDPLCFQQTQMGMAYNSSNAPLLLNIVEQLSGGADLIQVRSRGVTKREFTKMKELNEKVSEEYRPKIEALNAKLQDIAQKITTLKVSQDKNGNMVLIDPQQKKDLEAALSTQKAIQAEISKIKKEQGKSKDHLEMWITWLNLLVMPLLVAVVGLLLALRRISLRAAH